MTKYLLTVAALFTASSAFAFLPKNVKRLVHGQTAMAALNCTDFSGTWKGTCINVADGSAEEANMTVEQVGCEAIIIDNTRFDFGKDKTITETQDGISSVSVLSIDLNETKDSLLLKYNIKGESITPDVDFNFTVDGKGLFIIKDGKLLTKSISDITVNISGQTQSTKDTSACAYEKQ